MQVSMAKSVVSLTTALAGTTTQLVEPTQAVLGIQRAVRQPGPAAPAVIQQPLPGMLKPAEPLFKTARQDVREMVDAIVARRVGDPA